MIDTLPVWIAQAENDPAARPVVPSDAPAAPGGEASQTVPGSAGGDGAAAQQPAGPGFEFMMLILFGFLAIMIFTSWRSNASEKKKREALLNSLKKGAEVQTLGGIRGTITQIRDDEVVIRVDQNATLRVSKASVGAVLDADDAEA